MNGLVCLWKANSYFNIEILSSGNDFIVLDMSFANIHITIVNVYLRSDLGDAVSHEKYLQSLNELENILLEYNCNNILYCGDFNTDPFISRAWANFKSFLDNNDLTCFDVDHLDLNTFTHINYGTNHCRWFDHIIGRFSTDIKLNNIRVLNELMGSDHFPLMASFSLPNITNMCVNRKYNIDDKLNKELFIDWSKLSKLQLLEISKESFQIQGSFRNENYNECNNEFCYNEYCKDKIDGLYSNIVIFMCYMAV